MKASTINDSNEKQMCLNTPSASMTSDYSITKSTEDALCVKYNGEIEFGKVLIIGLGQLGLPVAKYISEKGLDTYGYDISHQALERAEKSGAIKKAINFSEFDIYILCISTHKPDDMFAPQIDGLMSIVEKISLEAKNGALVSIESYHSKRNIKGNI